MISQSKSQSLSVATLVFLLSGVWALALALPLYADEVDVLSGRMILWVQGKHLVETADIVGNQLMTRDSQALAFELDHVGLVSLEQDLVSLDNETVRITDGGALRYCYDLGRFCAVRDHDGGQFRRVQSSPSGTKFAVLLPELSAGKANVYTVQILDLENPTVRPSVLGEAHSDVSFSWSPNGDVLVFDDVDGQIWIVGVKDGRIEKLMAGRYPNWSPDGQKLAYVKEDAVYTYDFTTQRSDEIFKLSWWRRLPDLGFLGFHEIWRAPFWSPDGKHMAINLTRRTFLSHATSCLAVSLATKESVTFYAKREGAQRCGPWLLEEKKVSRPRVRDGEAAIVERIFDEWASRNSVMPSFFESGAASRDRKYEQLF